ncbi:hypothetical protein CH352_18915 [Leptospira hartskeerlii]|nr:hypothetical protein CH352_18915 [Leptospira hartskeerlii]
MDDPLAFVSGKFGKDLLQKSKFLFISPLFLSHCVYDSGEIVKSESYRVSNVSEKLFQLEDYDFSVIDNVDFSVNKLKSEYYILSESLEFIFAGLYNYFEKFFLRKTMMK